MLYEILENMKFSRRIGVEAIIVAVIVFALTCLMGKIIIPRLRAKKLNQPISGYVKEHALKSGTPTMGGICFIIASLITVITWMILEKRGYIGSDDIEKGAFIPMALTLCLGVGMAMIGFYDDYKKLTKKQNEGLSEAQKLILQIIVAAAYLFMMSMTDSIDTSLHIPFCNKSLELGFYAYPIYLLVIVGFVNSTNITDGLDGLASSVGVTCAVGIVFMSMLKMRHFIMFAPTADRYNAVVAASLVGALLGFLVFNHHPAKVFMGDTGSLYIGGIIMGCAIAADEFLPVLLMSFVFILDMLSSLLQRVYFKLTHGKRLFKKAPVHHHFQLLGWSETAIVILFFVVSAMFTALGVYSAVI